MSGSSAAASCGVSSLYTGATWLTTQPLSSLRMSLIAAYNSGRSTPSSESDRVAFGSRLSKGK